MTGMEIAVLAVEFLIALVLGLYAYIFRTEKAAREAVDTEVKKKIEDLAKKQQTDVDKLRKESKDESEKLYTRINNLERAITEKMEVNNEKILNAIKEISDENHAFRLEWTKALGDYQKKSECRLKDSQHG